MASTTPEQEGRPPVSKSAWSSGVLPPARLRDIREPLARLSWQLRVAGPGKRAREDEPIPAKTAAYKLTLLKKLSQSTRPSKIKETITDLLVVQGLYRDFLPILCALDLNHEGVGYYAHSVIKSEIFQVTRRSSEDRYLHLIAFITHQYFRLQDNLLDGSSITQLRIEVATLSRGTIALASIHNPS